MILMKILTMVTVPDMEVLYCLWRSTGTERLVHFIMGHTIDCLHYNDL